MPKIKYPYEYDPKKRRLAKIYSKGKLLNGIINGIFVPILFFAALYYSNISLWLKEIALQAGPLLVAAYAFLFISLLAVVQFPLRFYSSYIYEHKYGLSRHGLPGWFRDYFKSLFLSYLFSVPVIYGLYLLLPLQHWWVYAGIAYFFLSVFLHTIIPVFILPLFYKLKPYRDRAHIRKLLQMIRVAGVTDVEGIYVANESRRSVKANALFSGLGRTKRIVLFDTLLKNFTKDEVETVIAHEAGHYVNRDVWHGIILDTIIIFPMLFVIDAVLRNYSSGITDVANLPLIFLAFSLLELLLMPLTNAYSRHREAQADLFALDATRKPAAQASTEKRLVDIALGNHDPHPLIEFIFHTHHSAEKRVKMCRAWKRRHKRNTN